jgi:hypothetical protein
MDRAGNLHRLLVTSVIYEDQRPLLSVVTGSCELKRPTNRMPRFQSEVTHFVHIGKPDAWLSQTLAIVGAQIQSLGVVGLSPVEIRR